MKKLLFILMIIPMIGFGQTKIRNTQLTSGSQPKGQILSSDGATNVVWKTIITDSINNGVIERAPSQNAVFDALELKEPTLTKGNLTAVSTKVAVTGGTGAVIGSGTTVDVNEANIVHQNISGAGTNTHSQIDNHIGSTSNPHSVTATQVGLGNVTNDAQVKRSEMGAAGGVATLLANGKLPSSQVPSIAISETFPITNESDKVLLSSAEKGDIAIVSTTSKSYILKDDPYSVESNWVYLRTPESPIQSVNGMVGSIQINPSLAGNTLSLTGGTTTVDIGSATDVAANTSARHSAVTLGTANGLSLSTQQLSLGLSSESTTGALSSTDWNLFNGKQTAYTNLTSIGSLSNGSGFLKNNGSGTFSYTFPTFPEIISKPTTLAGYGITDAVQISPASAQPGSIWMDGGGTFGDVLTINTAYKEPQIKFGRIGNLEGYGYIGANSYYMFAVLNKNGTFNYMTLSQVDGAATFASTVSATQLQSTVATGTAPLTVASATMVSNLNADLLDGKHASEFITGTGTSGYLPVWDTGGTSLSETSPIYTGDGYNVAIGSLQGTGTRLTTASATGQLGAITNGIDGQILTLASGSPTWANNPSEPLLGTPAANGYVLSSTTAGVRSWVAQSAADLYKGSWDASTNTPTLANGTGTAGWYYICSTAGTVNFGAGNISFDVLDKAYYNGSAWEKISGSQVLQPATASLLGGVKIGSGVTVQSDGTISVSTNYQSPLSGTGFVKSSAGTISYDTNTYLTGITSSQVTTALGFTPYNSTNPAGYITSSALAGYATQSWVTGQNYLTSFTETDPTIYSWAKSSTKPSYSYSEVGAAPASTVSFPGFGTTHSTVAYGDHTHSNYLTGNQTITLSGIVTGSGTTAITTSIADAALSIAKTSGLQSSLDGKLSLSGGTLTGALNGTSITLSGNLTCAEGYRGNSDIRLKKNIKNIRFDASKIELKQFEFKTDSTNRTHYGVIAQEVEKIAPELVYTDEKGIKSVAYIDLIIAKLNALEKENKELQLRIEKLEKQK